MRATQFDQSAAVENYHRMRDSRNKILCDLMASNTGADTLYLHVHDSYVNVLPGVTDTFTVTAATNKITMSGAHATWLSGTPVRFTAATTIVAPLVADQTYYLINVDDTDFKVALTLENALAGVGIDLTDTGTGAQTAHILDWPGPSPVQVPGGSVASEFYSEGQNFSGGIFPIFSTSATPIVLGVAAGLFSANYTT